MGVRKPLVSVLMCVHNEEDWVSDAIASICYQDYKNWELVIVDDGSTDGTAEILEKFASAEERIKIVSQKNTGLTRALNVGLEFCSGEYVARMDADNISMRERLEKQVKFLEENPTVALVGSWRIDVLEDGSERVMKLPCSNDDVQRSFVKACVISHSAVMVRARVMKKFRYNEEFRISQDQELWTRIGEYFGLVNLPEVLTKAYYRPKSITRTAKKLEKVLAHLRIRKMAYNRLKCPWWFFLYIPKPILEFLIPTRLIEKYVSLKMRLKK